MKAMQCGLLLELLVVLPLSSCLVVIRENMTLNRDSPTVILPLVNKSLTALEIKYNIHLDTSYPPYPYLHFYSAEGSTNDTHAEPSCFSDEDYPLLGINRYHVLLRPGYAFNEECQKRVGTIICKGRRKFAQTSKKRWFVKIGYQCPRVKSARQTVLSLSFKVSVNTNVHGECLSMQGNGIYDDFMANLAIPEETMPANLVYFPNVFGLNRVPEEWMGRKIGWIVKSKCHQHLQEFMYRSLFPVCRLKSNTTLSETITAVPETSESEVTVTDTVGKSQKLYLDDHDAHLFHNIGEGQGQNEEQDATSISFLAPCRIMCQEMKSACSLEIFQTDECENYPTMDCYYKPIDCGPPPNLPNATIGLVSQTFAKYICNLNMTDRNESESLILRCLPSGMWSTPHITCTEMSYRRQFSLQKGDSKLIHPVAITVYSVICVSFIVISVVFIYYRKVLLFLFDVHCLRGNSNLVTAINARNKSSKPKVFISYSSLDIDQVEELRSQLSKQLTECQIITYEDDFIIGQRIVNCIRRAITESHAMILYLTENYVDSEWCVFEFSEAHLRWLNDKGFRLVIVADCEVGKLPPPIPHELELYLKGNIYMQYGEKYFWSRLKKALLT